MKKSKVLVAAIALLGFSTAASITGTVAWFTASNSVKVSGFSLQAETEQGIVISNEAKAVWKTSAEASHNGEITVDSENVQAKFVPTSTKDASAWYHGYAANVDNGQENEVVEPISTSEVPTKTGVYKFVENTTDKNVYLLNKFYIKSSGNADIEAQDIYVKSISAALLGDSSDATQKLSTSLRVLIKSTASGGKSLIFAPISVSGSEGPTLLYNVGALAEGAEDNREQVSAIASIASNDTTKELTADAGVNIPAYSSTSPLEFEVYAYFEGEDAACKSANIPSAELEKLAVSFELANKAHDNN